MSKATTDVLLWAARIIGRRDAQPHELLEISKTATLDDAQAAFHKIARIAHPDMHRTTLNAEELERVTWAYATVAAAYQTYRSPSRAFTPPPKPEPTPPRVRRASGGAGGVVLPGGAVVGGRSGAARPTHDPHSSSSTPASGPTAAGARSGEPGPGPRLASSPITTLSDGLPPSNPVVDAPTSPPRSAMSSKALVYYRKAEFALKTGDLRAALLNLRLAIAADPTSQLLRNALAEVEAEVSASKPSK